MSENNLDFLAIGDVVDDAFIGLKDAKINCDMQRGQEYLCVRFGDKIPYESVTVVQGVGNSPNASVSAARLGLNSGLLSYVGKDKEGQEIIETLKKQGVNTDMIFAQEGKKSNYHYVLRYEEERTILVKHEYYDYDLPNIGQPKWIYLSSLAENSLPFQHQIASYVKTNPEIKMAFQPGTFQIKQGVEELKDIYEASELFFCNTEEARRVTGLKEAEIKDLLKAVNDLGPNIVVITDGPKGAYAYDGQETWYIPMYPDPKPPVDRTGAGDSFSSTFTAALAAGNDIPTAISWGPINSMSVVQYIGAQEGLLSKEEILKFLEEAPANYKPEKII
ncbi:MAG: carbohydrate kinase family protein [Patescibacteria group bacterium]